MRVLYSFPHAVGRPGIGTTAFHQVQGAVRQGLDVLLVCTSLERELPGLAGLVETLAPAGLRVPHRALGVRRAYRLHDRAAARVLRRRPAVDVVHVWPAGSIATLAAARELGVPSVREVPNTHTAYAFEAVAREHAALGLAPVAGHSHTFDARVLAEEEAEYELADLLLVPSAFSRRTFIERGLPEHKLALHRYGYDPERFRPPPRPAWSGGDGLRAVFVGGCEPRKGLHLALRAWVDSGAATRGRFAVCGEFVPGYRDALEPWISHASVEHLGFVDPAEVMRASDVLVFPSLEEGSALVTYEAQASGCALAVSDAAGARCEHGREGLVHAAGDVSTLTEHLRQLADDGRLLDSLRTAAVENSRDLTWDAAAAEVAAVYAQVAGTTWPDGQLARPQVRPQSGLQPDRGAA